MKLRLPDKPKRKFAPQPKVLLSGSIPRPLSGVNPRSIKGKAWWDRQRDKAYKHNNYHCHACGVHKRDAKIFNWLEAHEIYDVDYENYTMTFKGIVALCHSCHSVIHAGRTTQLYFKGHIDARKLVQIVRHGQMIFNKYNLKPSVAFRFMELVSSGYSAHEAQLRTTKEYPDTTPLRMNTWGYWRLHFNGKVFPPKFADYDAWERHYHNWKEHDDD